MKKPSFQYLVASPAGDVPVDSQRLDYPLEADPLKTPYRTYFRAITDFLAKQNFRPLLGAVNEGLRTDFPINELDEIIIRTEKHGALYHPASIECLMNDCRIKFGLNVAVTDTGKESLRRESAVLKMLHSRFNFPYIPRPYYLDELHSMVFLLEEWFEGYHEFHSTKTEDGQQQIKLWEYGRGDRLLTPEQSFEIYRQAAQILTLYYDLKTFRLIYPWHHAAGDFVVKIGEAGNPPQPTFGKGAYHFTLSGTDKTQKFFPWEKGDRGGFSEEIDLRLTTVRGYEPFLGFDEDKMISPTLALFYFLLHLSIQMRLDKLDGIGDVVWADYFCVDAVIRGFLDGLEKKESLKDYCGSVSSFLTLLKSFTEEELRKTLVPIAEQLERSKDYRVIQEHLPDHAARLYITLQNYP